MLFPSEHQFALIAAVAEHKGVTAAANALSISQPAVTAQLQSAERAFGTALFVRSASGLRVTPAGDAVVAFVHRKERLKRTLLAELAELSAGISGVLVVGCSTTPAEYYIPAWVRTFRKVYPKVDLRIWIGNSQTTLARLREGAVDVAVIGLCPELPDLECETLAVEQIVPFTALGSAFDRRSVAPDSLRAATFVVREPTSATRMHGLKCLSQIGVVPQKLMEVSTNEAVIRMVEADLGVGLLSTRAIERGIKERRLAPVRIPRWNCERELQLVSPKGSGNVLVARFRAIATNRHASQTT